MVSKITCSVSNDVFQSIAEKGNVYDFLIIPIEEQICLDSISGWLPHFTPAKTKSNEDDSSALQMHTDSLIKMKEKGVNDLLSEQEEPMYVDNAQAVKRKLCLDMNESHKIFPQKRSRFKKKSKSLSGMNYRYLSVDNPKSNTEELCIPKRSLSLPDIRQLSFSDENHEKISALESFTNVPSKWMNFLEVRDAVEKEDDRLRTLISSSHSASEKQKLNSDVSDVPVIVINDASSNKKCGLKESKRLSCVRKLDWGECVSGKNLDERNSSKTPRRNKKLLDKTTVKNNFRTPVSQPITFNRASNVCNNVCTSVPEVSLGYETALITKQIRANNWTRNYSPASSSGYIPCAQPEPVCENNIEKPFNVLSEASPANEQVVCVEKDVNKGADSDHAACSEELFESDDLGSGNHIQRQRPVASNKSKSGPGQKKSDKAAAGLSVVFNKQDLVRSQGLTFTSVEVKKMCDVLLRLYSTQDG